VLETPFLDLIRPDPIPPLLMPVISLSKPIPPALPTIEDFLFQVNLYRPVAGRMSADSAILAWKTIVGISDRNALILRNGWKINTFLSLVQLQKLYRILKRRQTIRLSSVMQQWLVIHARIHERLGNIRFLSDQEVENEKKLGRLFLMPANLVPKAGPKMFRLVLWPYLANLALIKKGVKQPTPSTLARLVGKGWYAVTWDFSTYYHAFRLHPDSRYLVRFAVGERVAEYVCLVMGCRDSAFATNHLIAPLLRYCRSKGWIVILLTDDGLMISPDKVELQKSALELKDLIAKLGLMTDDKKTDFSSKTSFQMVRPHMESGRRNRRYFPRENEQVFKGSHSPTEHGTSNTQAIGQRRRKTVVHQNGRPDGSTASEQSILPGCGVTDRAEFGTCELGRRTHTMDGGTIGAAAPKPFSDSTVVAGSVARSRLPDPLPPHGPIAPILQTSGDGFTGFRLIDDGLGGRTCQRAGETAVAQRPSYSRAVANRNGVGRDSFQRIDSTYPWDSLFVQTVGKQMAGTDHRQPNQFLVHSSPPLKNPRPSPTSETSHVRSGQKSHPPMEHHLGANRRDDSRRRLKVRGRARVLDKHQHLQPTAKHTGCVRRRSFRKSKHSLAPSIPIVDNRSPRAPRKRALNRVEPFEQLGVSPASTDSVGDFPTASKPSRPRHFLDPDVAQNGVVAPHLTNGDRAPIRSLLSLQTTDVIRTRSSVPGEGKRTRMDVGSGTLGPDENIRWDDLLHGNSQFSKRNIETIRGRASKILASAIAPSTARRYDGIQRNFILFVSKLTAPPHATDVISPQSIVDFIAFSSLRGQSEPKQIRSALIDLFRNNDLPPFMDHPLVVRACKGLDKSTDLRSKATRTKLPFPVAAISALIQQGPKPMQDKRSKQNLRVLFVRDVALLLFGFRLMRRASEMSFINLDDIQTAPNGCLRCRIFERKNSRSVDLLLDPTGDNLCPVYWLSKLVKIRKREGAINSDPLFVGSLGNRISTTAITNIVRNAITIAGIPSPGNYSSHSLRKGGATAAAAVGLSTSLIRSTAGWSHNSGSDLRYVNSSVMVHQRASSLILSADNTFKALRIKKRKTTK
jgi:integrase